MKKKVEVGNTKTVEEVLERKGRQMHPRGTEEGFKCEKCGGER